MGRLRFDPDAPVIVLTATLEGEGGRRRRIRVALDTGATYVTVPWQIAEALGYRPDLSLEKVEVVTASGVESAPIIEVAAVKALGEEVERVAVLCHDLPPRSYVVGLLGVSFLRHFKLTIDYLEGVVLLEKKRRQRKTVGRAHPR